MDYTNFGMWLYIVIPAAVLSPLLRKIPKLGAMLSSALLVFVGFAVYASGHKEYYLLFLLSVAGNFILGRVMTLERFSSNKAMKKLLFIIGVSLDVVLLGGFKAATFLDSSFILPFGMSFFTFREISYLTDIYTGQVKPSDNIMDDMLYLTFFTQITSGPITKHREFYQLSDDHTLSSAENINSVTNGVRRVVTGLCKKTLIAGSLANIADKAFASAPERLSCGSAWIGAVCFSLQLYYDFSGYSDMAVGLTNLFGYYCPENFDYPYASASVSEFWRRWHITLGRWFRDYVYIPMGGSRVSSQRIVLNLLAVWLLTGLWHGSGLNFVVWGLIHFVFIVIERFSGIAKSEKKAARALWRVVTLVIVVLAWVMFRADSVAHGAGFIAAMFRPFNPSDAITVSVETSYIAIILIAAVFSLPVVPRVKELAAKGGKGAALSFDIIYVVLAAAGCFASMAFIANGMNNTFLYANF